MGDFHQLPAILTRPLDELTTGSIDTRPEPEPVATQPAPMAPPQPHREQARTERPHRPRHQQQTSALPSAFAWTSLFS
jgi:hypothetical protein